MEDQDIRKIEENGTDKSESSVLKAGLPGSEKICLRCGQPADGEFFEVGCWEEIRTDDARAEVSWDPGFCNPCIDRMIGIIRGILIGYPADLVVQYFADYMRFIFPFDMQPGTYRMIRDGQELYDCQVKRQADDKKPCFEIVVSEKNKVGDKE